MPNWSYTPYIATGDKEQLQKLHNIMTELESMKSPGLYGNGFGSAWLGNLVIKLGGNWNKVYCRGSWDNLLLNDDIVSFSVESAWGELFDVRHFIEEKFPGIKLYYECKEPGMGIYATNDDSGQYFPEKYYLWVEDGTTEYCSNLEALAKAVEDENGCKNLKCSAPATRRSNHTRGSTLTSASSWKSSRFRKINFLPICTWLRLCALFFSHM